MDRCIIYYHSISTANALHEVTGTTFSTLQNCKAIRENFWGDNLHREQGNGIPEDLDKQYYYHTECFKNYVYSKALAKRKKNKDACELSRSKREKSSNERELFCDNRIICEEH